MAKAKDDRKKATVDRSSPVFTLQADTPGAIAGLVALSRVMDTEEVHAALREFEIYAEAVRTGAVVLSQAE